MPTLAEEQRTALCRMCSEQFDYTTELVALPSGTSIPRTIRNVCDSVVCQDSDRQQAIDEERGAIDAARWQAWDGVVPQHYHRTLRDGSPNPYHAKPEHVTNALDAWHPGQSLFLYGAVGTGKTHQVAALMHRVAGQRTFEWHRTRALLAAAQAAIKGAANRPTILDHPCRPAVLVLDDIGVERPTPYAVEQLGEVIMQRYDAGLPVVVTSNYDLGELASANDALDRVSSRLAEMCKTPNGIIHRFQGQDLRVQV